MSKYAPTRRGGGGRKSFSKGNKSELPDGTYKVTRLLNGERVELACVNAPGIKVQRRLTDVGVADQILGIRPGAKFRKVGRGYNLEAYEKEIAQGLASVPSVAATAPHIDRNPYNFASWVGTKPWDAQGRQNATHEREGSSQDRLSGMIKVTLTARTPIFIPQGSPTLRKEGEPPPPECAHFFRCCDGERSEPRLAIPGSAVKGPVRALFEALTNSRCGVSDHEKLSIPLLYRRRAAQLFRVTKVPTQSSDGEVEECQFSFVNDAHHITRQLSLNAISRSTQFAPWRANLLWVDRTYYGHGQHGDQTQIAYKPTKRKLKLAREDFSAWQAMAIHPHFKGDKRKKERAWHEENVESNPRARGYYNGRVPRCDDWREELFELKEGQFIFGIEAPGGNTLACFGKNVNFLWPSPSPAQAAGNFLARKEEEATFDSSDPAELTFGYIAKGREHCFRGRVRFTTFWLDEKNSSNPFEVTLLPLTAPRHAKAKSRTLYYEPAESSQPPDPGTAARLRGRKFYWHQQPGENYDVGGVPRQHTYEVKLANGPDVPKLNPALKTNPLPAGATFCGEIHFSNLTPAELGALIAAVHPGLLFGKTPQEQSKYGLKIGKGKPRGLGSVTTTVQLYTLCSVSKRYRELTCDSQPGEAEPNPAVWELNQKLVGDCIETYESWAEHQPGAGANFKALCNDLANLTRIPDKPWVRVYPARFDQYAWPAGWSNPDGGPDDMGSRPAKKPRPSAMKRARDITVP